jgi:hypothetical protein
MIDTTELDKKRRGMTFGPWRPTDNNAPVLASSNQDFQSPDYSYAYDKFTAPISSREKRGLNLEDILSGYQFGAGGEGFNQLQKTTRGDYTSPTANPFFKDVLSTAYEALQPFIGRETSRLQSEATAVGQGGGFSSPLLGQEEQLSENVLNQLGAQIAPMLFGEYGRERGYQEAGGRESRQLPGQAVAGQVQAGGLERTIGQDALTKLQGEFQRLTGMSEQDTQDMLKILSLIIGPQQTQYGPSPFESIASAATPFIKWR